ncbi:hypothetical protein PR202_ga27376 [Eleusine coracana subsp. coracana]|uniref:DUF3741 domain-containing protein n=1 Tax=Eleusine coracana subsp. coracana TaxID=191504 RepID=A0AAV5DEE8_ELECO|nr:hypothetical protein PR202_ga27376 [Eleusine coracana subsp. coracana]
MFYSHHDAKLLLDRKQGSRRHTFGGFTGKGHSRKNSRDFEEIDEDGDNMEECSSRKPTVKRLMEDELGRVKQLKIPNDEVQRILADLGHGVCPKGDQNQSTSINVASPSGSLDASGSKCMKESEENELELALADFLGQVHSIMEAQPGKFRDALEMLSSDTELFLKIFQKLNSNILENIQGYQNREMRTKLEPTKMPGNTDSIEGTKITNQHEATKTHSKESRHIFFWKKERSNRRHTAEGINSSQPANKIVILKPNPRRGIDPTAISSIQAPELSATENSKFSIKEVRRRFRIVTSEARKEKPSECEDSLQKDKPWLKNTTFTIKRDTRQLVEQTSEEEASPSAKADFRPSTSSTQNQRNGAGGTDRNIIKSTKERRGEFIFYDEAKKHLTELLKDKNQTTKHPTLQTSRSLVRMLSLPQRSTLSPRNNQCSKPSPRNISREKDCIDLSPKEANICASHKDKEDFTNEESQLGEISCCATETPLEKWQCMKEENQETTQDSAELDTVHTEEIEKLGNSETISKAWCIPAEQCRQNPSQNMVEEAARENVFEKPECQEPATPRSPVELISQFSPDGNLEKQEQPSPVSVLDQFFHEDAENPDTEEIIKGELHEDMFRLQYIAGRESDQEIFWMDKDVRLGYIKVFLELSELLTDQNVEASSVPVFLSHWWCLEGRWKLSG